MICGLPYRNIGARLKKFILYFIKWLDLNPLYNKNTRSYVCSIYSTCHQQFILFKIKKIKEVEEEKEKKRKIYKIKRKRKEKRKAQGDILAYDDNDQRISSRFFFSPLLSASFLFIYL